MSEKQKTPDNATILIRLNGDLTTAVYLPDYDSDDGIQFGRGSTARRNPADKYDAYVGARLALDRLFGKDGMFADKMPEETKKAPEPEKTEAPKEETEFQVGDIVRVTNAVLTFSRYKNRDVAVVTKVVPPPPASWFRTIYCIKVRSKERKGSEGVAFAGELTLLHRPAKEGEK